MTTFATAIVAPQSTRYLMVRMTVGWMITSTSWTSHGSSVYSAAVADTVAGVTVNGTAYAAVSSVGALTTSKYYYDSAADRLYVYYAAAVPNASESHVVVVDYYLFLTEGHARKGSADLSTALTGTETYLPLILEAGPFSEAWENALAGVLTIGETSLVLSNTGNWIQMHIQSGRSLAGRAVDFWLCAKGASDALKIYSGTVEKVSISNHQATLDVADSLNALTSPAYMGDSQDQCVHSTDSDLYPDIPAADSGKPIRYYAGLRSTVRYVSVATYLNTTPPGNVDLWTINPDGGSDGAVCINRSTVISSTTNKTWLLGRVPTNTMRTQSFGTQVRSVYISPGTGPYVYSYLTGHNLIPGETVLIGDGLGGSAYFHVATINDFTYLGNDYNVGFILIPGTSAGFAGAPPSAASYTAHAKPSLMYGNGEQWIYIPHNMCTYTYTATDGGNYLASVVISALWTTGGGTFPSINPEKHQIHFLMIPSATFTHATVGQRILQGAGLSVNSASITSANADLNVKAMFSIPNTDETEYRTYREYLQDLLSSVGGYLRFETDGTVSYKLISTASTGRAVDEDRETLGEGVGLTVDYADIVTEIVASNPHLLGWEVSDLAQTSWPEAKESSSASRYLHKRHAPLTFRHCLQGFGLTRLAYLLSLRKNPKRTYSFGVPHTYATAVVGDDLALTSDQLTESQGSEDLKIIGRQRSVDDDQMTTVDLP